MPSMVVPGLFFLVFIVTRAQELPTNRIKFGTRIQQAKSLCTDITSCQFGYAFAEDSVEVKPPPQPNVNFNIQENQIEVRKPPRRKINHIDPRRSRVKPNRRPTARTTPSPSQPTFTTARTTTTTTTTTTSTTTPATTTTTTTSTVRRNPQMQRNKNEKTEIVLKISVEDIKDAEILKVLQEAGLIDYQSVLRTDTATDRDNLNTVNTRRRTDIPRKTSTSQINRFFGRQPAITPRQRTIEPSTLQPTTRSTRRTTQRTTSRATTTTTTSPFFTTLTSFRSLQSSVEKEADPNPNDELLPGDLQFFEDPSDFINSNTFFFETSLTERPVQQTPVTQTSRTPVPPVQQGRRISPPRPTAESALVPQGEEELPTINVPQRFRGRGTTLRTTPTTTTTSPPLRDVPAFTTRKPASAFTTRKPVPAFTTRKPVPAFTTRQPVPAFTTRQPFPAFTTRKSVPAFTTRKPVPAFTTRKPVPAEVEPATEITAADGAGICPESLEACVDACTSIEEVWIYSLCVVECGDRCSR